MNQKQKHNNDIQDTTRQANKLGELEPALDPITLERLRQAIGDLTPILRTVLHELPKRCASLRLAFDAGNAAQVDKLSHFIAGSVANLGATRLSRLARTLEEISKAGRLDAAGSALEQLEQEAKRVIAALVALLTAEQHNSAPASTPR